jgi:hypothetical protein
MVQHLVRQVEDNWGGVAAFNVWNYNPSFYTVPIGQRRVDVRWDDCQGKGWVPGGLFGPGGQFVSVPIPSNAIPAAGSDAAMTIYQPATDTMWDFWEARKRVDGWHACWGGRLEHVSRSPGYFEGGFGASASGLSLAAGQIGIREAQAGEIGHALALQIIAPAKWWLVSWPAQRSDGWDGDPDAIPEGTRLRLDPRTDVDALPLHPLARMVAKAAQKYGFIVTDKSGAVAVVAESGAPYETWRGVNPWNALLRGTPMYDVMRNFPWRSLQVLPRDYGKPVG